MPRKEPRRQKKGKIKAEPPVFGSLNYKLMGGGAGLIFLGFAIMALDNAIDGFLSLFVSPVLVIAGFIVFGFGIVADKKQPGETPAEGAN